MTYNAMAIAALQCDYCHYAICYIGSVAVVVPLWQKKHFCVAVLPFKRGNSSVIYDLYRQADDGCDDKPHFIQKPYLFSFATSRIQVYSNI